MKSVDEMFQEACEETAAPTPSDCWIFTTPQLKAYTNLVMKECALTCEKTKAGYSELMQPYSVEASLNIRSMDCAEAIRKAAEEL